MHSARQTEVFLIDEYPTPIKSEDTWSTITEENKESELWIHFKQWASESYTHGVDRMVKSKSTTVRIVWFFSFLIAVGWCSYLLIQAVTQYLSWEVTTKIRDYYSDGMYFPFVTMCNSNPMVTPAADEYVRNYYQQNYNVTISNYSHYMDLLNEGIIDDDNSYIRYLTYAKDFDPKLRDSFGYDIDLHCELMGWDQCDPSTGYLKFYDSLYGNCIQYNGTVEKDPLSIYGFYFIVFLGTKESRKNSLYYDFYTNIIQFGDSMLVMVNDGKQIPLWQNGIAVRAGNMALISVSKSVTVLMPEPYSNCLPHDQIVARSDIAREMQRQNISYSHENCLILCQQKRVIEKFGCYDITIPSLFDAPPCLDKSTVFDIFEFYAPVPDLSDCGCIQECEKTNFDATASYLEFPSFQHYNNMLKNNPSFFHRLYNTTNVTHEMMKESLAAIFLHYNEVKETRLEESASMTLFDLVGNVGGTMGLFLGFSLLVMVEFIVLLIEEASLIWTITSNKVKNKIKH